MYDSMNALLKTMESSEVRMFPAWRARLANLDRARGTVSANRKQDRGTFDSTALADLQADHGSRRRS